MSSEKAKKFLVVLGLLIITLLHFDFWWFAQITPVFLGFMPIALWFQVLIGGIVGSIFLHYAYKVIWPTIPEDFERESEGV